MNMKSKWLGVLCVVAFAVSIRAADKEALKDQKDKVSYSYGLSYGSNFKRQGVEIDPEMFAKGMKDALAGGETLVTEKEARDILTGYQKEMRAKQEERNKIIGEKNKKEGETFLSENSKKEGVKTLPSGLQYQVLTQGTGPTPKTNDTVVTQYRGTLLDGTEFDSSYKKGEPYTTPVNFVIPGWTEALQLMKVGSKWKLFVPSHLAYKERSKPPLIGPNATLVFELELLAIKPPATPAFTNQPVTSQIIKVPSKADLDKGAKIEIINPDAATAK
jgi:FKBP-type peptidyl-prolyl cis-trans isomerase FklB